MKHFFIISILFLSANGFAQNLKIKYNQISYMVGRPKIVNVTSTTPFQGQSYKITDSAGATVKSGLSTQSKIWEYSKEYVSQIDFSDFDNAGDYTITVGTVSKKIKIKKQAYEDLSKAALKYFYYNRASMALDVKYAGVYKRPLGHPDTLVYVHASAATTNRPVNTKISSPRGWYDAGDYNKYIVNSGISTYTLLAAYEHYPSYYDALAIGIPEEGGLMPDILDEVKWNLDWMITMQDPFDGGVYHKCTDLNFNGENMPHQYNAKRFVVAKSTAAALNFSAVFAVASRVYRAYDVALSDKYLAASIKAYEWSIANPKIYYKQPSDVKTGEYGDGNVKDEFEWAAAELLITTKEDKYKTDLKVASIGEGVPAWPYSSPLATISLLHHQQEIGNLININIVKDKLLNTANSLLNTVNTSPMTVAMGNDPGDYVWGSNAQAGNQIILLIRAYEVTNDKSYLDAAFKAFDYLVGRNGTGYSFVTGHGDLTPVKPHHRISQADGIAAPVPGMLAGGPHPGKQDGCGGYPSVQPALCYLDTWCSYSTNEVTINWNAPFAYAANALSYYQSLSIASSNNNINESFKFKIFPNPASSKLIIESNIGQYNYSIAKIDGVVLKKGSGKDYLEVDIMDLAIGMYTFIVENNNGSTSEIFVKK
jgi:endoglucanase